MKQHTFRRRLNDRLEDRLALSHVGGVGLVRVDHAHPTAPPALKTATVDDVNHQIDAAFARFNTEYKKEIARVDRTGAEGRFRSDFAASAGRLERVLDRQAARIPGGSRTLAPTLNARVDSLVRDLETQTSRSSTDLIHSDQSGAHADVQIYIHDAVARGDFSLR